MPERTSHTETVRAGTPLRIGIVTVLPIERAVVRSDRSALRAWFSAAVEPYALIVRDAGGIRAVDADATPISLEELREKIPGLDALMASTGP
jgi:hypothetical protein